MHTCGVCLLYLYDWWYGCRVDGKHVCLIEERMAPRRMNDKVMEGFVAGEPCEGLIMESSMEALCEHFWADELPKEWVRNYPLNGMPDERKPENRYIFCGWVKKDDEEVMVDGMFPYTAYFRFEETDGKIM